MHECSSEDDSGSKMFEEEGGMMKDSSELRLAGVRIGEGLSGDCWDKTTQETCT